MRRLNKKAFTLVEILVAIAILAVAVIGIGSVIISTQNNTTKRLSEADLQQQAVEIKENLHNELLSANLGVNCWIKEGDVYTMNGDGKLSDQQDKQSVEKIVALYNIDREDFVFHTTYYRWNKSEKTLSIAKTERPIRENGKIPSNDQLVEIDKNISKVVEDVTWSLVGNQIDYFNVRLENPSASEKLISVDINVAHNKSVYPVNDTIYVRNEIKTNTEEFLVDKYTTITLKIPSIPANSPSVFTYDGTAHKPKVVDYYENYMTIVEGSTLSASDHGEYYIRFELKDKKNYQWPDGTTTDKTIFWSIGKRTVYIDFGINSWMYDKQEHTIDYSIRGYDRIEELQLTFTNKTIGPDVCDKVCTATLGNPNFEFGGPSSSPISIYPRPASAEITLHPTTWNGSAQVVATASNIDGGTVRYYTNTTGVTPRKAEVTLTECKETNANTYYVFYVVLKDNSGNYVDSDVICAGQVDIMRSQDAYAEVIDFVYDTTLHKTNTSVRNNGVVWSNHLEKTDAGDYIAIATPDSNHTWPDGSIEPHELPWTIEKATGAVTPPVGANLTYSGVAQRLLSSPATTPYGVVKYKVGVGDWSESIPSATNAGTYRVYYYSTGNSNYHPTSTDNYIDVVISKANGDGRFATWPTAADVTYTGTGRPIVNAGTPREHDAVIKYALVDSSGNVGEYSSSIPSPINAGNYTVSYYIDQSDSSNYLDSKAYTIDCRIKRSPTAKFDGPYDKTYDGSVQYGYEHSGVVLGRQNGEYSAAGTYVTSAVPDSNHIWPNTVEGTTAGTATKEITWVINKRTNYITEDPVFASAEIQYNDSTQDLATSLGKSAYVDQKIEYKVKKDGDWLSTSWSTAKPQSNAFGTYEIHYRATGDSNHNVGTELTYTIYVKPNAAKRLTEPTPNSLTYTGSAQNLITAGTAQNGTFRYSVSYNDGAYGTEISSIPTGINAGTYTIKYRIVGNTGIKNWDDDQDGNDDYGYVTVTIARKKAATFTYTSATPANGHYTYDGTQKTAITGSNITYTYQGPGSSWDCTYSTYTHYYYSVNGHPENANGFTVKAKPDSNHCWSDTGGTEERSLTWYLDRAPTGWWWGTVDWVNGCNTLTYNGSSQSLIKYGGGVYITGSEYATDAGTYYITGNVDANHLWNDGTADPKYWTWYIANRQDASVWASNRTENGSWQTGCGASNAWKSGGTESAITYGDYWATYTAYANHAFSGGGTTYTVYWSMQRYVTVWAGDYIKIIPGAYYHRSAGNLADWKTVGPSYINKKYKLTSNSGDSCYIGDLNSRVHRKYLRLWI